MKFEQSVEIILHHEGGYVNHPADPGGETNFGISKRAYPEIDIRNLTREGAIEIYKKDYWLRSKANEMPDGIDLLLFDCAVNQGVGFASKALQRSCGAAADGMIGPMTLAAVGRTKPEELFKNFVAERAVRYANLNVVFHRGWFRRLADVSRLAALDMG